MFGAQKSLPESVYDPLLVVSTRARSTPTSWRVSPWMPEMSDPADGGVPVGGLLGLATSLSLLLERVTVMVPSALNVPASTSPSTFCVLSPVVGLMSNRP